MSNPKFKKGDVVVLKSGSPEMTIEDIEIYKRTGAISGEYVLDDEPKYMVVWLNDKKESVRDTFTESVLELSEE